MTAPASHPDDQKFPVIAIRADGNPVLASGHLRRSLCIAQELEKAGAEVIFCLADDTGRDMLADMSPEAARDARVLYSDFRKPFSEIPALSAFLKDRQADLLLVDHYHIDDLYLEKLRSSLPGIRLCVIDDFTDTGRPADLIINYVLPGRSRYVPLRPQFRDIRMPFREEVRRVFVSTGGSDPYGMREILVDRIAGALPGAEIAIPQGVDRMAAFMADCDLAVTAGGTTVYELCATGVPTILFTMADNQQSLARGLAEVIPNAGDVRKGSDRIRTTERIIGWLTHMTEDPAARRALSEKERSVTDGHGAERIAEEILALSGFTR